MIQFGIIKYGIRFKDRTNDRSRSTNRGDSVGSGSEEDVLGVPSLSTCCERCQEHFPDRSELLAHQSLCEIRVDEDEPLASEADDVAMSDNEEEPEKASEEARLHCQDVSNNNSVEERDGDVEVEGEPMVAEDSAEGESSTPITFPAASHVTLEALQNTKVAVAQFAATAMANNADNEAAIQELAVLQSTLFTLQHQQVFQLQLIQQLQSQLSINRPKEDGEEEMEGDDAECENSETPPIPPETPPPESSPIRIPSPHKPEEQPIPLPPVIQSIPIPASGMNVGPIPIQRQHTPPTSLAAIQPPLCSISSSLASTIITHNNDPLPDVNGPNTLEMLQRRAQEVLDNASQGLLAGNLADELAFRKSGKMSPYDGKSGGRNEPFFKHRCRYCGKVFGSDSALQIHIRSHTGERPFKCNVCGSRFTTKGNLKVHFQRHTAKFPHVKMNPNPIPEHLDKYHPPLLAQMSPGPVGPPGPGHPGGPPGLPPHSVQFAPSGTPFHPAGIPLYRPTLDLLRSPLDHKLTYMPPQPMFVPPLEQEVPADLSKPAPPSPPLEERFKDEPHDEDISRRYEEDRLTPKKEPAHLRDTPSPCEVEQEPERFPSPSPYDECSMESKYSNEDMLKDQDQPQNLSNKTSPPLAMVTRYPPSFPFPPASSPPSSTSSGSASLFQNHGPHPDMDPTKDPAIYSNLLPRPGSNDNSWESLIEVTKTSETSKLQQLVDNIENKLTDPNQCVICNRVLSCKSALQMHYRTHTGERPFRCRICGRAFTTKGNLKTHMGVHRMKPPLRTLHQCPVCHKKFTNALVLQQHIRLHTGEPTDLTPEQIQAAEVRDFPPMPGFPMPPFMSPGFPLPPGFPLGLKPSEMEAIRETMMDEDYMEEDDDFDDDESTSDQQMMPNFSTSLAALENQVRTITTMASQLSASGLSQSAEDLSRVSCTPTASNGDKSPTGSDANDLRSPNGSEIRTTPPQLNIPRPPSSIRASSPTPSDCSQGALDLTPRGALTQPSPPVPKSPVPPPGVFSNFALLPPGPSVPGSPLMNNALSSLTSSVMSSTAFSPLGLAVGPSVRGNTTCNICYKTFACHSALEIHYRSHTKERPFKCTVCDRGFSTKSSGVARSLKGGDCTCPGGPRLPVPHPPRLPHATALYPPGPGYFLLGNMKQHMLTHKIRDMPQHIFDSNSRNDDMNETSDSTSLPPIPEPSIKMEIGVKRSPPEAEMPVPKRPTTASIIQVPPSQPPSSLSGGLTNLGGHGLNPGNCPPPSSSATTTSSSSSSSMASNNHHGGNHGNHLPLPQPPPPPLSSKHLCGVCRKNFSSSSALQIHMRTHTGDKPFRCTVCQKAFTTKGNLKVHMGTHMWSNGASRRGRRMSLELPPRPLPLSPQDSDFLQRRPDLFYPYLPAPFLNGMQQKLNEISVIQQNNPNNGLTSPSNKYAGLLGFGPFPPESLRSQPGSPLSDKPPSSIHSPPPSLGGSLMSPREMLEREREREAMIRELERREMSERDRENVLPRMWDLHYERKAASGNSEEPIEVTPPQGLPLLNQNSRGEGLAA